MDDRCSAKDLEQEMTLGQSVNRLEDISYKINEVVFGGQQEEAKNPIPQAGDAITRTRDRLTEIGRRLENALNRLQLLKE